MKHITIKDIARKLNLSVSTISRAFNDKYDIRPETRELVLKTAREMGYRPNPIARKLIQQRTLNIGVVVPEFVNSFFPEVIIGAQEVLLKAGYQVLIMQSNESEATELDNVRTLVDNMVDGILISTTSESNNKAHFEELVASKMPVVFFNRVMEELEVSKVVFNDYKWAFFATEHLIVQGYKNIVQLCGPRQLSLTRDRIRGFRDAHRKHRLQYSDSRECGITFEDGARAARLMIEKDDIPDAIFASSDPVAIGAMEVFKKHGLRIPDEVAIFGFSESKLAPHVSPALSSVAQPTFDMGRIAAELLLEQLNTKGLFVPQTIVLNGKLNIRESSVKI